MKNPFIISIFIACLMGASGCTEPIDLDLNSTARRLVVEGFINSDTTQQHIRLTLSGDYFDNQSMPPVTGATVKLSTDEEELVLEEMAEFPGYYFTPANFYGKPGKTYHLSINSVDVNNDGETETYTAQSYMPPLLQGDSIQIGYEKIWNMWKVLLFAKDPQETENFYMFRLLINNKLWTNSLSSTEIADDAMFDGNDINGVWVFGLDTKEDENIYKKDTLTLEMCFIDETFFEYMKAIDEETEPKTPLFSGAPANVPGNISNNALGVFAAYSVDRLSTINTMNKEDWK